MARNWRIASLLQAGGLVRTGVLFLTGVLPVAAQIKIGDTNTSASGTIASGYTATFGNMSDSNHGWTFGGVGSFTGSYYSPNFLSYNISPYLNQSRANSNFQSISNASGINANVNLFGGSQFPGSITYSDAYNSEGNYSVPGLSNFVTHGNSQTFGINWSANLPNAPSLSAGFQLGSSKYSVYGTGNQGKNKFHSVNLNSGYNWEGFNMSAYYSNGGGHSDIPEVVVSGVTRTESNSDSLGVTVGHALPMRGTATAGFNRSHWSANYLGFNSTGTIDSVNSAASVHPTMHFSLSGSMNYSDNLSGQLVQSIIGVGGIPTGLNSNASSNSFDVEGVATYTPLPALQTSAFVERRSQEFEGANYGVNTYGGGAGYAHRLLKGSFNGAFTVTANASDKTGTDSIGFSTNGNYSTEIRGWRVNGTFGYAQNAQTLLITYMNSFYNFSGNVHRNWRYFNMSMGGGGSRTALTDQQGASSSSEDYNAAMGYGPWITLAGTYAKSSGLALATGNGLVPVPVPSPTLPAGAVSVYGGDSYAVGLSSTPTRGLVMSASWAKSISNTTSLTDFNTGETLASKNDNNEFTSIIQYQYRKLYFTSGYARLQQGFSLSGGKPEMISTYYMGITRWFKFF